MHNHLVIIFAATIALARGADFDIRDEAEFAKIVSSGAKVEKLAGGFRFVEGPVWLDKDGGMLIFSDIPANQLKKWPASGGEVTVFRDPSQNANGNTLDLQGRLVSAEHSGRRVSLTEKDGKIVSVVDQFDGKKFNSPNDVVVKS